MENKVMKTRNSKLQKAEMKSLTILVALFAVFFNVNARGSNAETQNNNALELNVRNVEMKAHEVKNMPSLTVFAGYVTEEKEAALELENWMVNENIFFFDYQEEKATEAPLVVEPWMLEANKFGMVLYPETETDKPIKIESWMLNSRVWSRK
ncbi:hypothetical protein D1164_12495 [Mariniphaga sediminis]|uniref:Uncharacterized protein n=2 Tax=Mariniphaga sediminis TaxID=1628158 RepID=A0A399CZU4_9BACT|nr:hypothetical protein D1164_12495 [Mariniphaga sediminis]